MTIIMLERSLVTTFMKRKRTKRTKDKSSFFLSNFQFNSMDLDNNISPPGNTYNKMNTGYINYTYFEDMVIFPN